MTSKEVENAVTPAMVTAGKLALAAADHETKSLENSMGEIYVAMAAKDHEAINEQKNMAQAKNVKRISILLYCGASAMLFLAIVMISIRAFALF